MKRKILLLALLFTTISVWARQQPYYDLPAGNGYGIRFWQQDNSYKIHMGSGPEYQFGSVTDYSIKTNMTGGLGRGWTWGEPGSVPVAALNVQGHMRIAGTFTAPFIELPGVNGNGIRFWQNDNFKIHMGNSAEYQYGPVTDYSIKINMDNTQGRGWTWGIVNQTPAAALSNQGHMQLAGSFNSQGIRIPGRYPIGQNESALEIEVPSDQYNAIRGYNGTQHIGTIHFFDDSYNINNAAKPAGSINLDGLNAVTIGAWDNPSAYFKKSDRNVGIGTSTPFSRLSVVSGDNDIMHLSRSTGAAGDNIFIAFSHDTGTSPSNARARIGATIKPGGYGNIVFHTGSAGNLAERVRIDETGNVGIGTTSPNQKLTVNGTIYGKEIKVDLNVPGPDYVFDSTYVLPALDAVEKFIDQHNHLPEVPSARDMEQNGINLSEMNMLLLKKIEELTLYVIELKKEVVELQKK